MATGKKAASKASKELSSKKSSKDEKTVAGSDLSQKKRGGGKTKWHSPHSGGRFIFWMDGRVRPGHDGLGKAVTFKSPPALVNLDLIPIFLQMSTLIEPEVWMMKLEKEERGRGCAANVKTNVQDVAVPAGQEPRYRKGCLND